MALGWQRSCILLLTLNQKGQGRSQPWHWATSALLHPTNESDPDRPRQEPTLALGWQRAPVSYL